MALRADHAEFSIPLAGAGGEAVSFRATLGSHGLAWLPPNELGPELDRLETTLLLADGTARRIVVREEPLRELRIAVAGRPPSALARREIAGIVRKMFGLDDDLAPFYARLSNDADLAFAASQGVGRMLRSPTAFEDVVRTICTTNCTWSATERMIEALVAHLGTPTAGASADRRRSRAFPSAQQLLEADDRFYREVARAGYRGAYIRALAHLVTRGEADVEGWRSASRSALSDGELEKRLLALPGVGPYAAAHVMMLFGRCSRLVLDSWTRPRYARLMGKKSVSDKAIARRFKAYGDEAGRAFWLILWKARHLDSSAQSRP